MKLLYGLLLCLVPFVAQAENDRSANVVPELRVTSDETIVVPGQLIALDVTVLVPTWMLEPPVFPRLEAANVLVRSPEGASGPVTEKVRGEDWSGVRRSYLVSPMIAGRFRLPEEWVEVTYANPGDNAPVSTRLPFGGFNFEGRLPDGAAGLEPFIAARSVSLEQQLRGTPDELQPGAAFSRTVTARIEGASAISLPPLLAAVSAAGLGVYAREPQVIEREERGEGYGERIEEVTYVAESAGRYRLDSIRLRWWNLSTQQVEVSELPEVSIVVGGVAGLPLSTDGFGRVFVVLLLGVLGMGVAFVFAWAGYPRFLEWKLERQRARRGSESYAFAELTAALGARDFGRAWMALSAWSARFGCADAADWERVDQIFCSLGSGRYGGAKSGPDQDEWAQAAASLSEVRAGALARTRREKRDGALPALNPTAV